MYFNNLHKNLLVHVSNLLLYNLYKIILGPLKTDDPELYKFALDIVTNGADICRTTELPCQCVDYCRVRDKTIQDLVKKKKKKKIITSSWKIILTVYMMMINYGLIHLYYIIVRYLVFQSLIFKKLTFIKLSTPKGNLVNSQISEVDRSTSYHQFLAFVI